MHLLFATGLVVLAKDSSLEAPKEQLNGCSGYMIEMLRKIKETHYMNMARTASLARQAS